MPDVTVKAPYNFVPLNKNVFFPDWAPFISHDVPFEKGLSGKLQLKITAETPIFVRGRSEKIPGRNDGKEYYYFSQQNGRHFIPGSSIRNMIRSVVEIMSFSKMGEPNAIFNDRKYGIRDFYNPEVYTLLGESDKIRAGWLIAEKDKYVIYDCGPASDTKIHHEQIPCGRHNFNTLFGKDSPNRSIVRNHKVTKEAKIAKFKYKLYRGDNRTVDFKSDQLVFTGQSALNDKKRNGRRTSKHHEFEFPKLDKKSMHAYVLTDEHWNDFKFIYGDYEGSTNISEDWKFWRDGNLKSKLQVPVFFRTDDFGINDFGLSMLYKMPYENRITDLLSKQQPRFNSSQADLAECIFGRISTNTSLKGRVNVSHAFESSAAERYSEPVTLILGQPRASYYPYYIKQNVAADGILLGDYKTFMDKDAEISGRKRYPVKRFTPPEPVNISTVTTSFFPLKEGASFQCTLNYHNLLPEELGALLSAITFHNTKDCRHNIGLAKAFGFGRIKIEVEGMNEKSLLENMLAFEESMTRAIPNWINSVQLRELASMAFPVTAKDDLDNLTFLSVTEYAGLKNTRRGNTPKGLPLHSKFVESTKAKSVATSSNIPQREPSFKIDFDATTRQSELKKLLEGVEFRIKTRKHATSQLQMQQTLPNLEFDKLESGQIIEVLLNPTNPKIVNIQVDNEQVSAQLVYPKGTPTPELDGVKMIEVKIKTLSQKKRKIVQVEFIPLTKP